MKRNHNTKTWEWVQYLFFESGVHYNPDALNAADVVMGRISASELLESGKVSSIAEGQAMEKELQAIIDRNQPFIGRLVIVIVDTRELTTRYKRILSKVSDDIQDVYAKYKPRNPFAESWRW